MIKKEKNKMSIELTYYIANEVVDMHDIRGGWNVVIDGTPVVQYDSEYDIEPQFEWEPEYIGEYIHSDLLRILDTTEKLASGTVGIYDTATIRFDPNAGTFLLEPLTKSSLRIAFQTPPYTYDTLAAKKSARGYIVDRCAFCRAVSNGAHKYRDQVRSFDSEWGVVLLEQLEEAIEKLDAALENCTQNIPSIAKDRE